MEVISNKWDSMLVISPAPHGGVLWSCQASLSQF